MNIFDIFIFSCFDDDNSDIECLNSDNRCRFSLSKYEDIIKGCDSAASYPQVDVEYRFNVIEEMSSYSTDDLQTAFKMFYLCNKDLCNSDDNAEKVNQI